MCVIDHRKLNRKLSETFELLRMKTPCLRGIERGTASVYKHIQTVINCISKDISELFTLYRGFPLILTLCKFYSKLTPISTGYVTFVTVGYCSKSQRGVIAFLEQSLLDECKSH